MGNYFATNMEQYYKKNHEFITELNNIKIERQLQMRNQMREREVAMEIAKSRELFFWFGAFYLTSAAYAISSYRYRRRFDVLAPIVPLTFLMAYQTDLAYGNKLHRIRVEAEQIMQFEQDLLALPLGVPTASSIDLGRIYTDEQKKLHPMLPPCDILIAAPPLEELKAKT